MKTVISMVMLLLAAGVGITVYLPAYEPENTPKTVSGGYAIDQDSLKKPYAMGDFLLGSNDTLTSGYGLRLGLFSELQQAIDQAKRYQLDQQTTIIKAVDKKRYWYLLVLGPLKTKEEADKRNMKLLQNKGMSADIVLWQPQEQPDKEAAASQTTVTTKQ